ncbi:hypothetical protein [Nocardiopsis salina]|uniref:hypothetical protein n=1 Tax=Nocardiopsis salina TaxID=245836 RepID=UPI000348758B|nr:hypothetical protein [Nocardiopsis salina]
MTHTDDNQLPDRSGDVIDDIRAALSQRDDLNDEHRAFFSDIVDRFEALAVDRDRHRSAWQSARERARRWQSRAELRVIARNRMKRQLDQAIQERDEVLDLAQNTPPAPARDLGEDGESALTQLSARVSRLEALAQEASL